MSAFWSEADALGGLPGGPPIAMSGHPELVGRFLDDVYVKGLQKLELDIAWILFFALSQLFHSWGVYGKLLLQRELF